MLQGKPACKSKETEMKRTIVPLTAAALFAVTPLALMAETNDTADAGAEAQMALAAGVSLQEAQDLALAQHAGTVAAIGFNDENGRGVYEAVVIGADGQPWLVKLDADTGEMLGQGLAALMDDEGDGAQSGDSDQDHGGDGETDDEADG